MESNNRTECLMTVLKTATRRAFLSVRYECSVTESDIFQDFAYAAWNDAEFVQSVMKCRNNLKARKVAFRFANRVRKRLCRHYRKSWPKLQQKTVWEAHD